jgi:hypothetical protein
MVETAAGGESCAASDELAGSDPGDGLFYFLIFRQDGLGDVPDAP